MDQKHEFESLLGEGLYAQSVAGTLRNMQPEQRAMAKIKIQQILCEIQYCFPQRSYPEKFHVHNLSNDDLII